MRIITVSREFGSGGRELGKRLAQQLDFDYYDSEIITAVAKNKGMDPHYVENTLQDHGWQAFPISFRSTLSSSAYGQAARVELLVEQKKVIEEIAALGKDCVIVGRNADVILAQQKPFRIFVCADTQAKLRRCMERAQPGEELSEKELLRRMKQIDKARARTREILTGLPWGERSAYHLTVNTGDWPLKQLAPAVAELALRWFGRDE